MGRSRRHIALLADANNISYPDEFDGVSEVYSFLSIAIDKLMKRGDIWIRWIYSDHDPHLAEISRGLGFEQKGCGYADAGIKRGVEMLLSPDYEIIDTICLATGDSDFTEHARLIKRRGKDPFFVSWREKLAKGLSKIAKEIIIIDVNEVRYFDTVALCRFETKKTPGYFGNPVICPEAADKIYRKILGQNDLS